MLRWEVGYNAEHGEEWLEYRKPSDNVKAVAWEQIRLLAQFKYDRLPPAGSTPDDLGLLVAELDKRYPE